MGEVRGHIQQLIHDHRGRMGAPLFGIHHLLRAGRQRLSPAASDQVVYRSRRPISAMSQLRSPTIAAQQVRDALHQAIPAAGRGIALKIIHTFPACLNPDIARLGKTLRRRKKPFLAYFATGASNGSTEAVNGIIELRPRLARAFRNFENYRLHVPLIAGGLYTSPDTQI